MNTYLEPDGKYLGVISSDFVKISDILKKSSQKLRKAGFEYPIFPICREKIQVGKMLIEKEALALRWNYYASFLDEFIQRGLVDGQYQDRFKKIYKDPKEYCCLFVCDRHFTQFVYIPYPVD